MYIKFSKYFEKKDQSHSLSITEIINCISEMYIKFRVVFEKKDQSHSLAKLLFRNK